MTKKIALAVFIAIALACGGGGGGGGTGGGGGSHGVTLNTYAADLAFNQTLNLQASVPGESVQTVTWKVTGGSITPISATNAVYTSPSVAGSYSITATSVSNNTKTATCVATVSQVGISIEPSSTSVNPNSVTAFTATVTGSTNTAANFTATGGTLVKTAANKANWTAPSTNGTYTITATAAANTSKKATATVVVANVGANATVRGTVLRDGSLVGVPNIKVAFYNSTGVELARATTAADGTFSALVPITAKRLHVLSSSLTGYYQQFTYATARYATLVPSCTAALPTLSAGSTVNLPSPIEITPTSDAPPPPPNGCS